MSWFGLNDLAIYLTNLPNHPTLTPPGSHVRNTLSLKGFSEMAWQQIQVLNDSGDLKYTYSNDRASVAKDNSTCPLSLGFKPTYFNWSQQMKMTESQKLENAKENYFGGCPECGNTNGYLNLRSTHVFVCDEHKTGWIIGANLFSCWKEETEQDWDKNLKLLEGYRKVKAIHAQDADVEDISS